MTSRDRDRQRELAIELTRQTGDEGERHEDRDEHQRDGDDRAGDFLHGLVSRLTRTEPGLDVAFDVFNDDDCVIHNDTDRQHQTEKAECIDREAKHVHDRECTDDGYRNGNQRDDRSTPCLQEQDDDENDERDGFEQRVDDLLDRGANELRRIIDDLVLHA